MMADTTSSRQTSPVAPKSRSLVGSRGQRRMRELAAEAEVERAALAAELVAGLGRPASAIDKIAVEVLSSTTVRARRLRLLGRSDREDQKILVQAVRAFGIRPKLPSPPAPLTLAQQLAARGYAPPPAGNRTPVEPDDNGDDDELYECPIAAEGTAA
jgi:hypothetical protein